MAESLTAAVYGGEVGTAAETQAGHAATADVTVSVLIPVRNEARQIATSVRSMQSQELPGTIEFIFADGRSRDGTKAILERLAASDDRIRVIDNPARLTPHGLNLGLRHARGAFVARMDGHAYYPPDYLARGVRRLMQGDVAWVSGPQLPHGEGWWSSRVTLALGSSLGHGGSRRWQSTPEDADPEPEHEASSASGVFLGVWRRDTLLEAGGWDEGWPVNQDVELLARLRERGQRAVSLPQMGVRYVPRNSPAALARQYFRYGFFRVKTSRRHPEALRPSHLGTPGLLACLLVAGAPGRRGGDHWIRTAARGTMTLYAGTLLLVTRRVARREAPADWVLVPAALAVMHLSWGAGFVGGCLRLGPPVEGLRRVGLNLRARIQPSAHAATAA